MLQIGAEENSGRRRDARNNHDDDEGPRDERELRDLIRRTMTVGSNVPWDNVVGLEEAKESVRTGVVEPLAYPQWFGNGPHQIKPAMGVLLYGPPGTGKTELAKAAATEARATFFNISVSNLKHKYHGNSERLCRVLFEMARRHRPSIIFLDEADAVLGSRDNDDSDSLSAAMVNVFLAQLGGVGSDQKNVFLIAASNLPWKIDEAILRRFSKHIHVPLPDKEARKTIFMLNIERKCEGKWQTRVLSDENYDLLAAKSEGFSGSDISNLVAHAKLQLRPTVYEAEYFRKTTAPVADDPNILSDDMMEPCNANDEGAFPLKERDIPQHEKGKVVLPKLKFNYVWDSLCKAQKTVSEETIRKCRDWKSH